ncbi:MAG TPA: hypothetical protein VHZ03_04180 [Trebonia sp.]|jgi:hypothetical protein|nr:hypothetical protein [Trebonia sp.]
MPRRNEVAESELADYDWLVAATAHTREVYSAVRQFQDIEEDRPTLMFDALAISPQISAALKRLGRVLPALKGRERSWAPADHEFIDIVLSLDSGCHGLLMFHLPYAIAEGVRIEAVEALRSGHEDELTADEAQQVDFIRHVCQGTMTDQAWWAMVERIGSERGVVEYTFFISLLLLHVRMRQALDIPSISDEHLDEMLQAIREGAFPLPRSWAERKAESDATEAGLRRLWDEMHFGTTAGPAQEAAP